METPIELTPGLEAAATPDDLKGRIEGLIGATVPPAQAKDLAQHIVETCGYDTPEALQDMDLADLVQAVPAVGHRKRVSRALFNGIVLQPQVAATTVTVPSGA